MDAFLTHNHVIILSVAAMNILLCLMPPYYQTIAKQPHFIDDNDDTDRNFLNLLINLKIQNGNYNYCNYNVCSIQESTTKVQRQNHKFKTEEEEEEEDKIESHKSNQVQDSVEQDDLFFRIYDDLKK